ncbi:MAG: hypothetical protein JXB50_11065 [Spirochaetes bacterium]|nr:hypothetical protein [Spirochaetota bacterium]
MEKFKLILSSEKSKEYFSQISLFLLIIAFLMPLLIGAEGICYDDAAFISFPRLMAVARAFQNGEIPFWDSNAYSGAKPYYSMMESPIYNFILYPFFYIANLKDIDQSFFILYILPFTLLTVFSGFGAYYLFRRVLLANRLISIICGFLYAINPSMGMSNLSLIDTCVFAYIPWILLSISKYLETHKFKWWISGILFFVMLNCAYTLNYTFRIYFIIAVITLILYIWYYLQDKKNIKFIVFSLFIFIIAIGLTAFIWAGIIEGISWVTERVGNRLRHILSEITNSLPPGHLITFFIPGFNGTLANYHTWGDGFLIHSADRILTGGVITSLLILTSILLLFRNKKYNFIIDKNAKIWLIIGFITNILALSIMLGRYSPPFYILCKLFPWFFAIPFPFYYHFAHHLGAIITLAAVLKILYSNLENIQKIFTKNLLTYYICFIITFAVLYVLAPVYYPQIFAKYKFNNFKVLLFYKDVAWFLANPISYFILITGSLIFVYFKYIKKPNIFLNYMVLAILIEALIIGYPLFYRNQIMPRAHKLNNWQAFRRKHHNKPSNFGFFKQINDITKQLNKKSVRFVSDISVVDNLSWVTNTRSFTGYEGKPVFKKMSHITSYFYKNWPYEMWAYILPKNLLSNMNVGYILTYNHKLGENKIYDFMDNSGAWFYTTRPLSFIKEIREDRSKGDNYPKYFNNPKFEIHKIDTPMPYIYFQKKLYIATERQQLDQLLYVNLRKGAYISNSYTLPLTHEIFNKKPLNMTSDEYENFQYREFDKFQKEKVKILQMKNKWNNKLELKVNVTEPCLMVRNEAFHPDWKVKINNKPGKIICINYIQQGVYLSKSGTYNIVFNFLPKVVYYGLIISLFFLFMLLIITAIFLFKKIKFFKKNK